MFGITLIDWSFILLYLLGVLVIGFWSSRKVKSLSSFFMGDRKFGKIMMMFFTFGTGTHSDQAVSVAAKTYQVGASGIWYQWLWLFVTPFFWLIAPIFRRMRAVTTGDYFKARYNQSVASLFAIVGILQLTVNIGVMLKGSSAIISSVSGGNINPDIAIIVMTIIFVIYGIAGGLNAAIATDFVQGILTIILSFLIFPFALNMVGGLSGLRETLHNPSLFKIVAPGQIGIFYVAVISINALIGWVTQPHSMCIAAAGKTELEGRVGVMFGILIKRVCTIAWTLTGLAGIGLYIGKEIHPDKVYGLMAGEILPTIMPGLIGIFIASMLAAVMSSCDAFMVSSSALFTENIYRQYIKKNATQKHYILVGRIVSILVVLLGILFAFQLTSVVKGLEIFWKIAAMMSIPFWTGLFWRKATAAAAWIATFASFAALMLTSQISLFGSVIWDFNNVFADNLPAFMLTDNKLSLPWQMIIYLTCGFAVNIIVSLLTKPEPDEKLDKLYDCLRTPLTADELETEIPCTLPQGVSAVRRNPLIRHKDFEIPMPNLMTIGGFFAGWVCVCGLIWLFYAILNM